MKSVVIREEQSDDADQIRIVNERAFGQPAEAAVVDALRGLDGAISLVAVADDRIVGHILFTAVSVEGEAPQGSGMGLAPMAVLPDYQRSGIGSQLVKAGLDACRSRGHSFVVVVGHPAYYPRFGFVQASYKGLEYAHPVPSEAFMAIELRRDALHRRSGRVHFHPEFDRV